MKKVLLLILLLLPFSIPAKITEAEPGLEISFRLYDRDMPVKDFSLEIFKEGTRIDSVFARKDKVIYLLLNLNSNYIIRLDKKGFRERLVMANTKVPSGKEKTFYEFSFDVNMIADSVQSNTKADMPIVLINWSETEGGFTWSNSYSESVNHTPEVVTPTASTPTNPPKKKRLIAVVLHRK